MTAGAENAALAAACHGVSPGVGPSGSCGSPGEGGEQPQGQPGNEIANPSKRHVYAPPSHPPHPQVPSQL